MKFEDKVSKVIEVCEDYGLTCINNGDFCYNVIESDALIDIFIGACAALDLNYDMEIIDNEFKGLEFNVIFKS